MKLNEINYYKNREISQSEYDRIPTQIEEPIKSKIGTTIRKPRRANNSYGLFSTVTQGKNDPFTVHKYMNNDPAYAYFIECVTSDPKARENPHFPRFKKIVNGANDDGYFQMEKLTMELSEFCSDTENYKMIVQLYLKEKTESYEKSMQNINSDRISGNFLSNELIRKFRNNPSHIANDQFAQALGLVIHKWPFAQKQIAIGIDLHGGNIMIRLTPIGPQLVITDPYIGYRR